MEILTLYLVKLNLETMNNLLFLNGMISFDKIIEEQTFHYKLEYDANEKIITEVNNIIPKPDLPNDLLHSLQVKEEQGSFQNIVKRWIIEKSSFDLNKDKDKNNDLESKLDYLSISELLNYKVALSSQEGEKSVPVSFNDLFNIYNMENRYSVFVQTILSNDKINEMEKVCQNESARIKQSGRKINEDKSKNKRIKNFKGFKDDLNKFNEERKKLENQIRHEFEMKERRAHILNLSVFKEKESEKGLLGTKGKNFDSGNYNFSSITPNSKYI